MKVEIKCLGDLRDFLSNLTEDQLAQNPNVLNSGEHGQNIASVEITEEPFLTHKTFEDDFGYLSELIEKHGDADFTESEYNVIEPIGTIIFFTN